MRMIKTTLPLKEEGFREAKFIFVENTLARAATNHLFG